MSSLLTEISTQISLDKGENTKDTIVVRGKKSNLTVRNFTALTVAAYGGVLLPRWYHFVKQMQMVKCNVNRVLRAVLASRNDKSLRKVLYEGKIRPFNCYKFSGT